MEITFSLSQIVGIATAITAILTAYNIVRKPLKEKEAESAYHSKLAYAAQSSCDTHTVSLLDIYGCAIRAEHYNKEEEV